jgi:hypothetical protein
VTVDLTSLPDRVELAVGQDHAVVLPSYAGSGNAWSAACVDGPEVARAAIEVRADAVTRTPPRPGEGPPAPFLVPEVLTIRALRRGRARWRLTLSRDFAPQPPTAEHDVEILVR